MHIITKARTSIAGRLVAPGTVLDLPEAEVAAALASGDAVPWPEVAMPADPAEGPVDETAGEAGGGSSTVSGAQTLV